MAMPAHVRKNVIDWNKARQKAAHKKAERAKKPEVRDALLADAARHERNILEVCHNV